MRCNLGWDYVLYSEFFLKMEKLDKAKDCIERAIGIFKICGADGWAQKRRGAIIRPLVLIYRPSNPAAAIVLSIVQCLNSLISEILKRRLPWLEFTMN